MAQISKPESNQAGSNNASEFGKRIADQAADAARQMTAKAEDVASNNLVDLQKNATATLETERALASRVAEDSSGLGRALAQLVSEQAQHNVEVFTKLTRTFSPFEAVRIHSDFLRASMDRTSQFTRRYFEITQASMVATMSMAKDQADRTSGLRR